MNHEYSLRTEADALQGFVEQYPRFGEMMPSLLDTLFRVAYFIGDQRPEMSQ